MRQIVPTMVVAVMLFLTGGSSQVYGQEACTFTQGFAALRALIGEAKVGACIENERFNAENGNSEQQTAVGLMVWRKIDNFTAFTDGGTTWINGPNGLEARPNNVRLAWELDPVSPGAAPAVATPKPLPTLPVTTPLAAPRVLSSDGGTIGTPSYTGQAAAGTTPPPPAAPGASTPTTRSPANVSAAANSTGASTLPPPPGAPAPAAAPAPVPAPAAAPGAAPAAAAAPVAAAAPTTDKEKATKTPTPKPAVTAKFSERPDEVDTGNDAKIEVETNVKKGTCSLTVTYRSTSETPIGGKNIDDGKCEWKFTLPADTKTGKAKAVVIVTAAEGTTTIEDTFEVKKGDTVYAGSIDLEVDPIDMPDGTVDPGEEIKIGIDTNLKRKGSCDLTMTWPKVGVVAGESQMPDDSGKCAWKMKVPADAPRNSSANLLVTVRKDGSTVRTLSRDFKVAK